MRLFIAINFSEKMAETLYRCQTRMYQQGVRGRYIPGDNLHLTLAFLGECRDVRRVKAAMRDVTFRPFRIQLGELGHFGDLYWMGVRDQGGLATYTSRLRLALTQHGIRYDHKPFRPHVTLVRKARLLHGTVRIAPPGAGMRVTHIALMKSERIGNRMVYTEI